MLSWVPTSTDSLSKNRLTASSIGVHRVADPSTISDRPSEDRRSRSSSGRGRGCPTWRHAPARFHDDPTASFSVVGVRATSGMDRSPNGRSAAPPTHISARRSAGRSRRDSTTPKNTPSSASLVFEQRRQKPEGHQLCVHYRLSSAQWAVLTTGLTL